jgi:predicted membrane channel-forming protein YqfA (hemolysin III family)
MIKFVKYLLFIIPTLFMGLIIYFVPELSDATSVFYTGLISVFLGVDIMAMIKKTKTLPSGEFDKLKIGRYLVVGASLVALLTISYIQYKETKTMVVTLGAFSSAVFIIAGILIAGFDGNRMVTYAPEDNQ